MTTTEYYHDLPDNYLVIIFDDGTTLPISSRDLAGLTDGYKPDRLAVTKSISSLVRPPQGGLRPPWAPPTGFRY